MTIMYKTLSTKLNNKQARRRNSRFGQRTKRLRHTNKTGWMIISWFAVSIRILKQHHLQQLNNPKKQKPEEWKRGKKNPQTNIIFLEFDTLMENDFLLQLQTNKVKILSLTFGT